MKNISIFSDVMFDSYYPYTQVDKEVTTSSGYEVVTFTFAFTSKSGQRYLIFIEEYPHKVCAVKFCPKAIVESDKKYNKLTGWESTAEYNYYPVILGTCIFLMVEFYRKDTERSFLFIGAPVEGEQVADTRRFLLYSRIMPLRFSDLHFRHLSRPEQSVYLMLNRKKSSDELLDNIKTFMTAIYPSKV